MGRASVSRAVGGGRRWLDAATAPTALDPDRLAVRLREASRAKRWLRPVAYVGIAMLSLVGAALTILRNWRLVLLEAVPAIWLGSISWQWRRVVLMGDDRPVVNGRAAVAVAVLVVVVTAASYWCNVTFALTVRDPVDQRIHAAFQQARAHARWIWLAAAVTATAHVAVVVWVVRTTTTWFALSLGVLALVQMYAFVAVPVLIATGTRTRRSVRDRLRSAAASMGVSGLTATPGLVLNRVGVVLLAWGWLRWLGVGLIAVAALLQVAGISSATAVKFAGRLTEADAAANAAG
jgi:hypothetical protein